MSAPQQPKRSLEIQKGTTDGAKDSAAITYKTRNEGSGTEHGQALTEEIQEFE